MASKRQRSLRISYANVTASLALFISLGGVSYAAFSLPAHSVGARELRQGAVTTETLGFPLGAASATDSMQRDLAKGPCNAPHRPGEVIHIMCPKYARGGVSGQPLLSVATHGHGHLSVAVIAGTDNAGQPDTHARVTFDLVVDGHQVNIREVALAGGEHEQVPIQALVHVSGGRHTIDVREWADYSSYEPGDVIVGPVTVVALSLP